MKVSDIIKESDDLSVDQIAQVQSQHGSPISTTVIARAKRIVANNGISALDALGMAQDIERKKQNALRDKEAKRSQDSDPTVRKPMTRKEPMISEPKDRVGKTGKKWGNQYYNDPKQPSKRYRDAKDAVKGVLGKIVRKDAIDLGKDIGDDFVNFADKLMKKNVRKK